MSGDQSTSLRFISNMGETLQPGADDNEGCHAKNDSDAPAEQLNTSQYNLNMDKDNAIERSTYGQSVSIFLSETGDQIAF